MKLINHLNRKLVELWRWNAAVGKRNEEAVVRAFGKVSPAIGKVCSPFAAYARSWSETIEDALWLPVLFHWFIGTAALMLYHVLTDGVPLPADPLAAMLAFGFWSFVSPWASKVVMLFFPQPYAWFANRYPEFVGDLVALST